jgi:hypothetical protein
MGIDRQPIVTRKSDGVKGSLEFTHNPLLATIVKGLTKRFEKIAKQTTRDGELK